MRVLLSKNIKPYVPLSFDENKKNNTFEKSKHKEDATKKDCEQGYKAGYKEGYAEGISKGYEEGIKKGEKEIKEKTEHFIRATEILKNIIKELTVFKEEQITQSLPQILKLSFKIAEKIVAMKISLDRDVIISVVKEALKAVSVNEERIIIKLNPDDYNLLSERFEELEIDRARLDLQPSPEIKKGGCLIETKSQHIDSTVEQRFREIENALNSVFSHEE